MKRLTLMATLLVALAGCATALNDQLAAYQGQPIQNLVAKLGFPNSEQTIMRRKVYTWSNGGTYSSSEPVTTTTTGYIGTRPVSATSTSYISSADYLSCTIRIVVDENDRIMRWQWSGNNGPCLQYSSRLKR